MIRCCIVDDEAQNISLLQKLIHAYCPQLLVCGTANDIATAKTMLQKEKPQLVFLDIEMPGGTGFQLLEQVKPVSFEVIFVTAFGHHAVKAFRFSALDYLLKPVMVDDLVAATKKAVEKLGEQSINQRLEAFLQNQQSKTPVRMAIPSKEGLEFYNIADIVYCSAEGSYTQFFLADGRKILTSGLLKDFEELLPADTFCRIHHSYVVNLNFIKKYYRGRGGHIELLNGHTLEVSNQRKDDLLDRFR